MIRFLGETHRKREWAGVVICCMDFNFIGGSLGSVMGEKIAKAVDYSLEHKLP